MGADPADSFEAPENPQQVETCDIRLKNGVAYLVFRDFSIKMLGKKEGSRLYEKAEKARAELASRIRIETPDAYLNTLGGALALAADGIWDGQVWLHGAAYAAKWLARCLYRGCFRLARSGPYAF